jgi:hypothetical protein
VGEAQAAALIVIDRQRQIDDTRDMLRPDGDPLGRERPEISGSIDRFGRLK